MTLLFIWVFILFSIIGISVGFFLIIKPHLAIEIQRRFYEKINWKIEPVSMEKEVRNTRVMGWFLIVLCIVTMILALTKSLTFS